MSLFKCQLIREERLFENMYMAEVKVINNSLPQTVGVIEGIQHDGEHFHFPIRYVKTSKDKGIYHLYYQIATDKKNTYLPLNSQFNNSQIFALEALDHALYQLKSPANKVLLFSDESALLDSLTIIDFLFLNKIETYLYIKTEQLQKETINDLQQLLPKRIQSLSAISYQEVSPILAKQVIGTKLFISGGWPMVNELKDIANSFGFSDDEIQVSGIGRKNERIFCIKCYHIIRKKNDDEATCENCNTTLDASTHFSKRHDAYLGYIKVE
ncbi:dimethylamine monooxygenase subunit DmmA family protein [Metabacillus litoralis]|uniref:dimethylamine monooxygenase subunit DmmA family protein n=1 Tax=Metabacillus litoralis TaxID=152268 RepID=UPI00203C3557|nr:dimethylamine monooxygenase subunit DmmA family protein [Metabacillus litoralis]MCM3651699.1 hypothetical protein [Metabacillus litoralis]